MATAALALMMGWCCVRVASVGATNRLRGYMPTSLTGRVPDIIMRNRSVPGSWTQPDDTFHWKVPNVNESTLPESVSLYGCDVSPLRARLDC